MSLSHRAEKLGCPVGRSATAEVAITMLLIHSRRYLSSIGNTDVGITVILLCLMYPEDVHLVY